MEPNIAFPAIYALNGVDYHQNAADRHACVIYGHRKLERRRDLACGVGRYHAASDDHNKYAQRYYENFYPDLCAQRILLCKSVGNKSDGNVLLLSVRVGHAEHCQPDQRVAQKSSAIGLQASINAVLSISRYT